MLTYQRVGDMFSMEHGLDVYPIGGHTRSDTPRSGLGITQIHPSAVESRKIRGPCLEGNQQKTSTIVYNYIHL